MASTAWYRTGTVTLAQNSTTVTGTGTQWNNPLYGVAPGQMLLVPGAGTVVMYEIQRVVSDTQITLATAYTGSAATGQQYAIVTALVGSVADFSRQLSVLVNQWQSQLDGWQQILSGTGDVKLTAPDGSTVTVKSQAALTAAINNLLDKTTTIDQNVASTVLFSKPTRISSAANSSGFIPGTQGAWVSWNRKTSSDDGLTGATDFITHKGSFSGGWNFWSSDGNAVNLSAKMSAAGYLTTTGGIASKEDQIMQAGTATPNLLLRFKDVSGVEKGAIYSDTSTGNMTIRWNGQTRTMVCNADGTVTFPSAINIGTTPVLKMGDYGLGGTTAITIADANTAGNNQFIRFNTNTPNSPSTTAAWAGISGGFNENVRFQMVWGQGSTTNDLRTRARITDGTWSAWATLWHSTNTTVDSNGFIKKASPIIRLSNDPDKMSADYLSGFTLDGVGAVNSEAAGVTAQRLATGIYQIIGSLGLATEGWQIEIPQDANGNRLVFSSTEVDEDGTIRVYTHKRRFDSESAMVVAGEAMDIPEGRWIDLRLSMPTQPEPEIVEPEEVQPASEVDTESTADSSAE